MSFNGLLELYPPHLAYSRSESSAQEAASVLASKPLAARPRQPSPDSPDMRKRVDLTAIIADRWSRFRLP